MTDSLQPQINRARLRALLDSIAQAIEQSPTAEVFIVVAMPVSGNGAVKVLCADTGSRRYGAQALDALSSYLKTRK